MNDQQQHLEFVRGIIVELLQSGPMKGNNLNVMLSNLYWQRTGQKFDKRSVGCVRFIEVIRKLNDSVEYRRPPGGKGDVLVMLRGQQVPDGFFAKANPYVSPGPVNPTVPPVVPTTPVPIPTFLTQAPTSPTPSNPAPRPTFPTQTPTSSEPTNPLPSGPVPTSSEPTNPVPNDPGQSNQLPTSTEPISSVPNSPAPPNVVPTNLDPTDPFSANAGPTDPLATNTFDATDHQPSSDPWDIDELPDVLARAFVVGVETPIFDRETGWLMLVAANGRVDELHAWQDSRKERFALVVPISDEAIHAVFREFVSSSEGETFSSEAVRIASLEFVKDVSIPAFMALTESQCSAWLSKKSSAMIEYVRNWAAANQIDPPQLLAGRTKAISLEELLASFPPVSNAEGVAGEVSVVSEPTEPMDPVANPIQENVTHASVSPTDQADQISHGSPVDRGTLPPTSETPGPIPQPRGPQSPAAQVPAPQSPAPRSQGNGQLSGTSSSPAERHNLWKSRSPEPSDPKPPSTTVEKSEGTLKTSSTRAALLGILAALDDAALDKAYTKLVELLSESQSKQQESHGHRD